MRYARQIVLGTIGEEGQETLSQSTVAVVGVGALGSVAADLLVRAGVGKVILVDKDVIDLSNLQRVALFTEDDVGKMKASAAKEILSKVNSDVEVVAHDKKLDSESIELIRSDVVIDCTDNLDVRFLINKFCISKKIPWVYGAGIREQGSVFTVVPGGPCLKCIYPNATSDETCAMSGVLNTITHVIASMQVSEGLKVLLGKEPCPDLLRYDVWKQEFTRIKVKKNPECEEC